MTETAPPATPDFLSADGMRPHLGDTFQLGWAETPEGADPEDSMPVELVDVAEVGGHSQRTDSTAFSLLFRGPKEAVIEQRIYRLEHETLGVFELFLVCVGPDPDDRRMRYEAVFT